MPLWSAPAEKLRNVVDVAADHDVLEHLGNVRRGVGVEQHGRAVEMVSGDRGGRAVADLQPAGGGLWPAPHPVALDYQATETPCVERMIALGPAPRVADHDVAAHGEVLVELERTAALEVAQRVRQAGELAKPVEP